MKIRVIALLSVFTAIISGCGVKQEEFDKVKRELEIVKKQVIQDSIYISHLRDTITMLSFPADQRLALIKKQVAEGEYNKAQKGVDELNRLFPNSKESQQTTSILQQIDNLIAKKKAEEERQKALGFKALKPVSSATIDYNKLSFSSIGVSRSFHFDSYGSGGFQRTADRGNTYVVASMSVTSTSKSPDLPTLAVYSIQGDKMHREGIMEVRFARWEDYGYYLGNYPDYGNDFAKTSTVRFKLGVEVSSEITNKPYAVVLKKSNGLSREYDSFKNPPVSYSGYIDYPYNLSIDDFSGENARYVVIKISNLK